MPWITRQGGDVLKTGGFVSHLPSGHRAMKGAINLVRPLVRFIL
jgi:hypothetical protein